MRKAVVIIPARFNSVRFPGKPLAILNGKPLIQLVYEQSARASLIDTVFVATDDRKVFETVTGFGGKAVMTSPEHPSGTDRVAEAAADIDTDIVVNVQGDEPFIRPEMVDEVVQVLAGDDKASISTLARRITDFRDIVSPHVVKVVVDEYGFAMYFSRSPIPYYRDEWHELGSIHSATEDVEIFKHIGLYGFKKDALMRFVRLGQCRLETIEKLEQLRALYHGLKIKVKETFYDIFGIDTVEDLRKAEEWQSLSL